MDSDKRFRFEFALGNWPRNSNSEIDDEFGAGELSDPIPTWAELDLCVDRVVAIERIRSKNFSADSEDRIEEEEWLQHLDKDQIDGLTEEIVEELEKRLCKAIEATTWPATFHISGTANQSDFFLKLQSFYQNQRRLFGALVTPLVQGIRVFGPFADSPWAETLVGWVRPYGQGVGHEQGDLTGLTRIIAPELAEKFSATNLVCLVDRAMPAMTGDAPILLEHPITRGYLDRLAFAFTHYEFVDAPDLEPHERRAKVLEGLSNAIQDIGSLPKGQKVLWSKQQNQRLSFSAI